MRTPRELKWLLGATIVCTVTGTTVATVSVAAHAQWAEPLFYIFTSLGLFLSFCSGFYILFTYTFTGQWPGEKRTHDRQN